MNTSLIGCKSSKTSQTIITDFIKNAFEQFIKPPRLAVLLSFFLFLIGIKVSGQVNEFGTYGDNSSVYGYRKYFDKEKIITSDTTASTDYSYGKGANGNGGRKIIVTRKSIGYLKNGDSSEYIFVITYYESPKKDTPQVDTKITYQDGIEIEHSYIRIEGENGIITTTEVSTVKGPLGEDLFSERDQDSYNKNTFERTFSKKSRKYIDKDGKKHSENYDYKTSEWKNVANTALPQDNLAVTQQALNSTNISFLANEAFIGATYLNISNSGAGNGGYGSYGISGEYTRYVTPHFGATLDFGVYFKKEKQNDFTQSYTQFNITAGPTYIPCSNPWSDGKRITGNLHALFGVSRIMVKESSGSYGSNSISKSSFTMGGGGALDYHISHTFKIRLQTDYMRTSFFNTTQNNFRISVGPTIGF